MLTFILACGTTESPTSAPNTPAVETSRSKNPLPIAPQVGGASLPGSSAAEDLSSSWSSSLAIEFTPSERQDKECPDQDKDGFKDVWSCPWLSSAEADCDDTDNKITPDHELWVPASPFLMGSASSHAGADESPVHVVTLSGYCLDKMETSVGAWSSWLRSEQRTAQGADLRSVSASGVVESGRSQHPAEGVTYEEARDYCSAQGKRLPTEAEFEKAARGGCELGKSPSSCDAKDLRAYPWGNKAPSCQLANHQLSVSGFPQLCTSDTLPVNSLAEGAGPYGHLHLSGNVWEYVLDYWHPKIYTAEQRLNPAGPKEGSIHTLKGGGWNTFSTNMRAANRFHDLVLGSAAGFRCARSSTPLNYDAELTLELITISGKVDGSALGKLEGRALYITAFDAADADAQGMVAPGRSPIAEQKLTPNKTSTQAFSLEVPKGGTYIISAALDGGSGAQKEDYVSASGSGGFGRALQPISAEKDQDNIGIQLIAAPTQGQPAKKQIKPPKHRPPQHQKNGPPPRR